MNVRESGEIAMKLFFPSITLVASLAHFFRLRWLHVRTGDVSTCVVNVITVRHRAKQPKSDQQVSVRSILSFARAAQRSVAVESPSYRNVI